MSTERRPILESDEISLLALVRLVRRDRRVILASGALLALLVALLVFFQPRQYTSTAVFMPQSTDATLSRLSGLAAQFGVTVPRTDPGTSPAFYASLLRSRDILRSAVLTPYLVPGARDSARATLVELYHAEGDTPAARRDAAVGRLLKALDVEIGRETELISIDVTTPWATVSQQVGQRLLDLVSQFNLSTRQTKAGAERKFIEARLQTARAELLAAEQRQQDFLERNRMYRDAPALVFENDRLSRDVQLRQQVVTSLVQAFEQARIDEVRNTPVITVVEPPDLPPLPDSRRLILKTLLALFGGLLLGTFVATLRQFSHSVTEHRRDEASPDVRPDESDLLPATRAVRPRPSSPV